MICYQDEKIIEIPDCSLEELNEKIKKLEIKNFGHEIDYEKLKRTEKTRESKGRR